VWSDIFVETPARGASSALPGADPFQRCNLHEQIRIAGDSSTVGLCIDLARARVLSTRSTFSSAGIEVDLKPAVLIGDKELEFAHTPVLPDTRIWSIQVVQPKRGAILGLLMAQASHSSKVEHLELSSQRMVPKV
jgi:hypothetical protein